jgi:large subunit ribosomal protein L10
MENPRPEKVAVVAEVKEKLAGTESAVLTEYRGLNVSDLAQLRAALREAGGEYKIYKNTLVRFAAQELELDFDDMLVGPTAIALVAEKADGTPGDAVSVAKALADFAKTNDKLVIKGGMLDNAILSADEVRALSKIAPREVLLAQFAGAMAAPMQQFAALLKAVPQSFAYGLQALIDEGGAPGAPASAPPAVDDEAQDAPVEDVSDAAEEDVQDAPADETPTEEAVADDAPAEETASDDAPAEEEAAAEVSAEAAEETTEEDTAAQDADDSTEEE